MAKKRVAAKAVKRAKKMPQFGAVSTINTAPVSVGNSVRGCSPRVSQTTDGARVVGRDFAFALSGTAAAVTGWEIIGSMPITPAVLPSSILRNYCQMFNKFKVNKLVVHYITSSPTSQAGDVLFYYEKDRMAPMVDYSNSSFLPYVLSDPHTVIGPQWTNHSIVLTPTKDWKTTLFGNQTDLNEDAEGTIFFFSKTNAANSPGYLLIDYDLSFRELSVNPRAGSLPVARGQSTFVGAFSSGTTSAGSAWTFTLTGAKNIANVTSALPNGYAPGDIYKAVLQVSASVPVNGAWSGTPTPTTSNMLQYSDGTALTIDDGTTLFISSNDGTNFYAFPTLEQAAVNISESPTSGSIEYQTATTTFSVSICMEIQLVRNINSFTQSAY